MFDAPATGHALAMLRSPHTFGTIARVGPVARQAGQVRQLLEDPARSAYLAVTHATEMGVSETLELREALRRELGRELDSVIVNGTLPRRFEGQELQRIAALRGASTGGQTPPASNGDGDANAVTHSAARAAQAVHERTRTRQRQVARLRRGEGPQDCVQPVLRVPFLFRSSSTSRRFSTSPIGWHAACEFRRAARIQACSAADMRLAVAITVEPRVWRSSSSV